MLCNGQEVKAPVGCGDKLPNGAIVLEARQSSLGSWYVLAMWPRKQNHQDVTEYVSWWLDPDTLACDCGRYTADLGQAFSVFVDRAGR